MTVSHEFKQMLEEPNLFLKKYFDSIRNDVELRVTKQEAKQEIIAKINEFESKIQISITSTDPIISKYKESPDSISNEKDIKSEEIKLRNVLFNKQNDFIFER